MISIRPTYLKLKVTLESYSTMRASTLLVVILNLGPATPGLQKSVGVAYKSPIAKTRHFSKMVVVYGNIEAWQQGALKVRSEVS